ncbi:uncharacterized protein LOC126327511 isoform X3 [Schistocerca gregaria]|uniref:uncharacterized protein LOC126327511 isoform X3 n=1 Tax=Schistocerca gregaria TaxID=7010 RepID=UPI00211EF5EA|nr:uncharacterized protein LOC126327511 isoform X3 [Schistocerca gregaria]XP_049851854.1 uncharacterized protein LOC126327511 isoform X3 [Schistocerca gregaria]
MDSTEGDGGKTYSSDSSTGEPTDQEHREDSDSSSTGSRLQRTKDCQQPKPEVTAADDTYCDEYLLDVKLTLQLDPDTEVCSSGSGDFMSVSTQDTNTSNTGSDVPMQEIDDDVRRRKSSPSSVPSAIGEGQVQSDVLHVSDTSKGCNSTEQDYKSENDAGGGSRSDISPTSDITTGLDLSLPFTGSSYSLIQLCFAYERALEAVDNEKQRQEYVATVCRTNLTKVTLASQQFHSIASALFGESLTYLQSSDFPGSSVGGDEDNSIAFEQRLEALKAYVSLFLTDDIKQQDRKQPVGLVDGKPIVPDRSNLPGSNSSSSSGDTITLLLLLQNLDYKCVVREAANSFPASRKVVVCQSKVVSKLCALVQRHVSKIEMIHQMILTCLKTVAIYLTPTVRSFWLMEEAVRILESEGHGNSALSVAFSVITRWTGEALLDGEKIVSHHMEVKKALASACSHQDAVSSYQLRSTEVFRDVQAAGDRFLQFVQQPDTSHAEIRNQELNMKLTGACLLPDLKEMGSYETFIEQCSETCSDSISVVLETLSSLTQNACNGIEASRKVVEVLVSSGVSFKNVPLHHFKI